VRHHAGHVPVVLLGVRREEDVAERGFEAEIRIPVSTATGVAAPLSASGSRTKRAIPENSKRVAHPGNIPEDQPSSVGIS
jgi:hypothetical protein